MKTVLVFLSIFLLSTDAQKLDERVYSPSQGSPLCNLDGIHLELLKAIEMLKKKSTNPGNSPYLLRQDDDDDDIPYYVPAIAKVVGSVLAQNATNIIEESFGFIPPEINKNIRYVIGLVADTVAKLRPTPAPTEAPLVTEAPVVQSSKNVSTPDPLAGIEALLAYALAQQVEKESNAATTVAAATASVIPDVPKITSAYFTDVNYDILQLLGLTVAPQVIETSEAPVRATDAPPTVPKLFSATFKYSEGQSVTSGYGGVLNPSDELPVYAPAYAPNYSGLTTKIPQYAPSFGHNDYTTPTPALKRTEIPSTTSAQIKGVSKNVTKTTTTEEQETVTEEEAVVTSPTEDDDDEAAAATEDTVVVSSTKKKFNYGSTTTVASTTTEDEYEEPEDSESKA